MIGSKDSSLAQHLMLGKVQAIEKDATFSPNLIVRPIILTIFLLSSVSSCNHNKESNIITYGDSSAILEIDDLVQIINKKKSTIDKGWPSPVKGFINYHFEKPIYIENAVAGYMVRDYKSDTAGYSEDYWFSEGRLIFYVFQKIENGETKGIARYVFKNNTLIDSSTALFDPPSIDLVLEKGTRCYILATTRQDSLSQAMRALQDSLKHYRITSKQSPL